MSVRILVSLLLILVSIHTVDAQVTGSFRSKQNGNWNDFNTWERYDGAAWVAAVSGQYPDDPTVDVTVRTHTVTVTTTAPAPPYRMRNLTVQTGGKLYCNINTTGGGRYLGIYGTSLVCDGVIGNYPTPDDISFNIEGANVTISGAGAATAFAAARIRKHFNASGGGVATTNLIINRSLYLTFNGGAATSTQLYNDITGTFNVTVAAGVTVNLTGLGNVSIDGTGGADANSSRGTLTVNGTLNIPNTLYLKTNNTGSPGNAVVIGPGGIINTGTIDAGASGSAGHSLTLQENASLGIGGKLNITAAAGFTAFSTTNNAYNLGTYYTTVEYSAAANQNVRSELTYAKLTLSGSGNKILLGNTNVNGNLLVNGPALDVTTSAITLRVGGNLTLQNGSATTTNALNYMTLATAGTGNQLFSSNTQPIQAYAITSTKNSGSLVLLAATPLRVKTDLTIDYTGAGLFSDGGNILQVGDDALFGSASSTAANFDITGTLHFTEEGTTATDNSIISDAGLTDVSKAQLNNVLVDPMPGALQTQVYVQPATGTALLTVKGTLAVANTASLQPMIWLNGNALGLRGDLTLYDVSGLQTGAGKVTLNGPAPQHITSPNGVKFYTFEINSPAFVSLSTSLIVDNQLFLTNGLVVTDAYEVYIATSATTAVAGHGATSYIVGNLRRKVISGNAYDFPVGTATDYQLASVAVNNAVGLNNLLVFFNQGLPATLPDPNVTKINGTPINDMLNAGFWTVTPDAYTSIDYDITLFERGYTNFNGVPVQLGVIKRHDAALPWWGTDTAGGPDGLQGVHTNATQSIANGTAVAKRSHLHSLSDFAIGFGNYALPVTMTDFTVKATHGVVDLLWRTASEMSNDRFDVQRSSDGLDFQTIGSVNGHGTTAEQNVYRFTDEQPYAGLNYYRLAQVDENGAVHLSVIRTATIDANAVPALSVFPVPAKDNLFVNGIEKGSDIQIIDLNGKEQYRQTVSDPSQFLDISRLAAGTYLLRLLNEPTSRFIRFSVQR